VRPLLTGVGAPIIGVQVWFWAPACLCVCCAA